MTDLVSLPLDWRLPANLRDQVALVVGGSSGIGLAIARELARCGCRVAIASRTAANGANAAGDSAAGALAAFACDIRSGAEVASLFERVVAQFGTIDLVIHSAGIGRGSESRGLPQPVARLSEAEWQAMMDTNLRGAFFVARAAGKLMRRLGRGQILNISSARGARRGLPLAAPYCAAKMAVLTMFQSLAEELQPFGVRVWSLLPDAVATSLIANTSLARRGSLSAAGLASVVVYFLGLAWDAQVLDPVVEPFEYLAGGVA
ncbi:MAG TPA: SDR family oxidoreductase [Pirellulales bacterium]|jgi:NAD(P)-dependent dehydrogenase (short-subunit alcohol dehydrogenase family)|nr:SDR family oxidoreductase [Pirellulales bacterium]